MNLSLRDTLKPLLVPGGVLLLAATLLLQGGLLPISLSAVNFYYYAVFIAGILLAWRFHSSRVLFALLFLLLGRQAIDFFSAGRMTLSGPGPIAFETISFLLPMNFVILSFIHERGVGLPSIASRLGLLFVESVYVAVLCRPSAVTGPAILHSELLGRQLFSWTRIPQFSLLVFAAALAVLLTRFLLYRKPVESGLLWSLAATLLGLQAGGVGRLATAFFATSGLILVTSIIENSYVLAYHDELTSLPSRRAFNDALLRLEEPYAIAVVDIDHFKGFNDTYGHETGDQVLRLVAAKLARVTGGGQAFRVGGEEFSILFPGRPLPDTVSHLDALRAAIQQSTFRVRGSEERRRLSRGPDRRTAARKKVSPTRSQRQNQGEDVSVTVSIGVAGPTARTREVEQVIQAADKALYRAKQSGRNRVETAASPRARQTRNRRSIA